MFQFFNFAESAKLGTIALTAVQRQAEKTISSFPEIFNAYWHIDRERQFWTAKFCIENDTNSIEECAGEWKHYLDCKIYAEVTKNTICIEISSTDLDSIYESGLPVVFAYIYNDLSFYANSVGFSSILR